MERSGDRLQALLSIVSTINSSLDPARLFENVMETARLASGSGLDGTTFRAAVASALGSDKKRSGDCILFALPLGLGSVRVESIPLPELEEFARRAP